MESIFLQFFGLMESIANMIMNMGRPDIGLFSTICLGLCSLPLVWQTIKQGHCKNISKWFVWAWFLGDISGCVYVFPMEDLPLVLNYGFNTILATTMLVYKIRKG